MRLNDKEVLASEVYLRTLPEASDFEPDPGEDERHVQLAIVVVTVRRVNHVNKPLGYLTRVVASVDRLIKEDRPAASRSTKMEYKTLTICNVDAGPGRHEEVQSLAALHYFHIVDRFPNGSIEATIMNPFAKEKEDYAFCLRHAIGERSPPDWILLIEDDAVPRDEIFESLRQILGRKLKMEPTSSFFKLYYPERWQGYSFELHKILELFAIFAIGGCTLVWLGLINRRSRFLYTQANGMLFVIGGAYLCLVALAIGRQHLLELRRFGTFMLQLIPAPDCCSPALLYPLPVAMTLADYLDSVRSSHISPLDNAIDSFSKLPGQSAFLVEPNLFRHVGLISTIKGFSTHLEEFLV